MSRVRRFAMCVAMSMATLVIALPVKAQTTNAGWQFEITPYGWWAGLKGSVRDDDLPDDGQSIDQTWSDLFAKLERALMGTVEVRRNRWGGMFDAVDFRLRGGGTVTGPRGFTSLTAEGALAQKFYSTAAVYRVHEGKSPVDLMAGARYALIGWEVDVEFARPPIVIGTQALKSQNHWIDPIVGARIQQPISKRWSLTGYGDVGGFGVGSRLTMQGLATARFAFTRIFSTSLAYRAISEDYDKDGFKYEMVNAGPMLGISFRW